MFGGPRPPGSADRAALRPRSRVTAGYRSPEHCREVGYSRPRSGMTGNGGAAEEPTRAGLIEERQ